VSPLPDDQRATSPRIAGAGGVGVASLSLSYNRMDLAADHGLAIFTYAAEPGSRSEEALNLLGSWAATVDRPESAARPTKDDGERDTQSA